MATPRTERLPSRFEDIDAAWMTRTVQTQYPGVVVHTVEPIEVIPGHTGTARFRLGVNPAGVDAGFPAQVCVKSNWSGFAAGGASVCNEARYYRNLATEIPVPSPTCHFADWDDDEQGTQGFVVLEDLVPLGGEFGASDRPIGIDDMAQALEGLARMHGASWGHPVLDRETWLQRAMAPGTWMDDYWGLLPEVVTQRNIDPERLGVFPDWAAADPNRIYSAFRQLCARELAHTGPVCLLHGDAHLGNSYRRPDGTRLWFDWGIVRKGLPWRDVSYFLVGSMDIDDRRAAERDLVQHYLELLAAHGGPEIPPEAAWDDFRRMILWGIFAWQININPQQDTMSTMRRFCAAAIDHDIGSLFTF